MLTEPGFSPEREMIARFAEQGDWMGGDPPYGYVLRGDTFVVVPEQGPTVQRIFAEHLAGRALRAIARALNADGERTATGGRWNGGGVRDVVANPAYCGTRAWGRKYRVAAGTRRVSRDLWTWSTEEHEALVSREDWEEAQEILHRPPAEKPERLARPKVHALQGLVWCERHGVPMETSAPTGRRYFRCRRGPHGSRSAYLLRAIDLDDRDFPRQASAPEGTLTEVNVWLSERGWRLRYDDRARRVRWSRS